MRFLPEVFAAQGRVFHARVFGLVWVFPLTGSVFRARTIGLVGLSRARAGVLPVG